LEVSEHPTDSKRSLSVAEGMTWNVGKQFWSVLQLFLGKTEIGSSKNIHWMVSALDWGCYEFKYSISAVTGPKIRDNQNRTAVWNSNLL